MINYGILSTASIAQRFIQGIRETADGFVLAVASRSEEAAASYAEKHDIPRAYGSYEALLADSDIDVVYIPTVNALHYELAKASLLAGKHVVMEKPFVLKPEHAVELFDLAHKEQKFLMEAQKIAFLPTTEKVKELLDRKAIGDLKYIECKAGFPGRFCDDHWMYDHALGGGCLYGSASYTIEWLSLLLGGPDFSAHARFIPSPGTADDLVHFTLTFDGILVASTVTMNVPLQNEAVFYGTEGKICVPSFWKADRLILETKEKREEYVYPRVSEFTYEVEHVHECLKKGLVESPIMTRNITETCVRLVDLMYQELS